MLVILSALIFLVTQVSYANITITIDTSESYKALDTSLYHYFGRVPLNSLRSVTYAVKNTGRDEAQFSEAVIWGSSFDAFHTCSRGLRPNEQCRFEIRYWPFTLGIHSGQFMIRFQGSSFGTNTIRVDLWGEGV